MNSAIVQPQRTGRASRRWRRAGRSVLALGLVAVGLTLSASAVAAAQKKSEIEFFGDSLTYQAIPYLDTDFDTKTTTISTAHVFPGTAICDWLPAIDRLDRTTAPVVAVLQFVGNHFTPCIEGVTPGSPAFLAQYAANLTAAITKLRSIGVSDVVADVGPVTDDPSVTWYWPLVRTYKHVVASFHSSHVVYAAGADRSVETPSGHFSDTLPCLSIEAKDGLCAAGASEVVRSADGLHFCPTTVGTSGGIVAMCPVYASGAYRFALGMAKVVWGLFPRARPRAPVLAADLSSNAGPATGGTSLVVHGANLDLCHAVEFEFPLPTGQLSIAGVDLRDQTDTSVTVTVPDLAEALGITTGTVYVSAVTPTRQSPWLALSEVEYAF